MRTRTLGDLEVSAVGLGAMGFSHGYGPGVGENEAIELMRKAFELGCTFVDIAEGYAGGANEQLVGRALAPIRDEVVLATKFFVGGTPTPEELRTQVRARLEASLSRLGTDRVELYYQHRVPDSIPVGDAASVMGELIAEGKILGWGQSQATEVQSASRARRHAVDGGSERVLDHGAHVRARRHSRMRGARNRLRPVQPARERFLSGKVAASDAYTGGDVRRVIIRFDKDNI